MRSALAAAAGAALSLVAAFWLLDLRLNTTASQPRGIYQLAPPPAARGDLVVACVPAAARDRAARYLRPSPLRPCDGLAPVMKTVAAVSGDFVDVTDEAVVVNGLALPGSAPLESDRAGRPLAPAWRSGTLAAGQLWLVGRTPHSYDSRYFGPVDVADVHGVATPLWLWSASP